MRQEIEIKEYDEKKVPLGTHIHLDEYNSLEDGSRELIIEKIN